MRKTNFARLILFLAVALIHGALILFFAIRVDAVLPTREAPVMVMKLTDIQEETPPAPPPPPEPPPDVPEHAVESIAETMIETEVVPEEQVIVAPGTLIISQAPVQAVVEPEAEVYLAMHQISVPPQFSEADLYANLVYPTIALRSGIEGTVILELVIDRRGVVRDVIVLRETPEGRGFGEAAVKAFLGVHCTPAQANGQDVATRYRYPVRFTLKG
jgi:protein TonB